MDWTMNITTIFPRVGWTIDQTIDYAIDTAKRKHATIELRVNDILLTVNPDSRSSAVKNMYLKLLNAKSK